MTFRALYRSILGQSLILTALFVGWGLYVFAIQPLQQIQSNGRPDPLDATRTRAYAILNDFSIGQRDTPGRTARLEDDPFLQAVVARNPAFHYQVRVGDQVSGRGAPEHYYDRLGLQRITQFHRAYGHPELCLQMEKLFGEGAGRVHIYYSFCRTMRYVEMGGLTAPVVAEAPQIDAWYKRSLWRYGRGFVYPVAGAFLIYALILLYNMVMIRRVARVARGFDIERLDRTLPERGLPDEVVPLVRAVNAMIGRMAAEETRRKFFLSAAAHEMRTPLTVVRTRLELLDDGPVKDKLVGDVRQLVSLVSRLLTLMGIDGKRTPAGIVELVGVCTAVVEERIPMAVARDITLGFLSALDRHSIVGDMELVEVAVANLVDNALSFAEVGGTVSVSIDIDGVVCVRDDGPGIDPAHLDALFVPFFRYPSNRNGFGLGLAIVRAVTTLHGGRVVAANADGGGARFMLEFVGITGSAEAV